MDLLNRLKSLNFISNTSMIQRLLRSSFIRNVAILASGTALSQIITIAVMPLLSRLFSPEDFGVLAIFSAIVGPIAIVACLRYEMAIMLPNENSSEPINLLALSLLIALLVGTICLVSIALFGAEIVTAMDCPALRNWLFLVPVSITIQGIYYAFRMWALRKKQFHLGAVAAVTQTTSQSTLQLTSGLLCGSNPGGLIWGQVLGRFVGAGVLIVPALRRDRQTFISACSIKEMHRVAARYRNFPLYQSWGNLLSSFSRESVVILIGFFFGSEAVGLYFMGSRILNLPLLLVGRAIGDTYYENGTRKIGTSQSAITFVRITQGLTLAVLPVSIIFVLIAPHAFSIILGQRWYEAGVYMQLLTPFFAFRFIVSPLARAFSIYERQRTGLLLQIALLSSTLGAIFLGGLLESIHLTLLLYSLSGMAMYVILLYVCLRYTGASVKDLFRVSVP